MSVDFEDEVEELVLLPKDISQSEYKTILRSLKSFLNSLVAPMGAATDKAIKSLRRQKETTQNLLNSLREFNKEIAVTNEELNILQRALKKFISLPRPMYDNITNTRKYKFEQNTAMALLEELVDI
ncbi:MAG: hypothetical protein ACXAC7_10495 [Candidatus Hodarchaeales archaeon]|jgi:hypothetical protein